jgi:hypothetical protein
MEALFHYRVIFIVIQGIFAGYAWQRKVTQPRCEAAHAIQTRIHRMHKIITTKVIPKEEKHRVLSGSARENCVYSEESS